MDIHRAPTISVIIRSYERGAAVIELIVAILAQQGVADFEIVVVEQSQHLAAVHVERLAELGRNPRVRILNHQPLGGPAARNVGARAARGDLLVFMDDDELPASDHWLAAHVSNFRDPHCIAVTGRHVVEGRSGPPYRNMDRARAQVCSYVPLVMWQRCYTAADMRCVVPTVHGGNVSIRRSALEQLGLWDECTRIEDELSFNYRLLRGKRPSEYAVFDPQALMIRRRDLAGGMGKRQLGVIGLGERVFEFLHRVLAHYFPVRFVLLYPVYVALLFGVCCDWIWNDLHDQGSPARRIARIATLFVALPVLWLVWSARIVDRRLRQGPARLGIERVPRLEPRADPTDLGRAMSTARFSPPRSRGEVVTDGVAPTPAA